MGTISGRGGPVSKLKCRKINDGHLNAGFASDFGRGFIEGCMGIKRGKN